MATLIDKTFFVAELAIPVNLVGNESVLNSMIQKYETKFMKALFGTEIYDKVLNNGNDEPWKTLKGLLVDTENKRSCIANYVYFKYLNNQELATTGTGVVKQKSENSYRSAPTMKIFRAMSECREDVNYFIYTFMPKNTSLYPTWIVKDAKKFYYDEIKGVNFYNL